MTDIAVIGAGIAGLVCAQQLSQAGYSVVVVEKSRGLGGRLATRRLHGTFADHGACYLKPKGELFRHFVEILRDRHILEVWTDEVYELTTGAPLSEPKNRSPRYVAPGGMSAIAKSLAPGLEILLSQRVIAITPTPEHSWRLTLESSNEELTAKAIVVAIPAPQAVMLLEPLGESGLDAAFLDNLRSVEFYPSISAIAGYASTSQPFPQWKALTFVDDADLAWIGLDSSKRPNPQQPHFVVQSSADFAQRHLESQDLQSAGQVMLQRAAESLSLPWLNTPEWMQVHRWRYAFSSRPWHEAFLSAKTPLPLVCCGDWCGGNFVEGAMLSGLAAADEINNQLRHLPFDNVNFLNVFVRSFHLSLD
ncbi:MAG: NAD(P)/FAD-dependent oxidoreductase [Nostoc sp. EfeVER01]|uniref:NAD(P)/FAD-dependent oxidoreductase n=1 Tax=unclassified Nostoc TaxID=2593658 RepID=UPI002AD21AF6|nr:MULTISPECIES: NAD(P)/FAD-dependent oxidoreductase [unclassified Nostoc]MDZ7949284.1 NAD(P)/FAD-dependent oxidoreductase [Nostoc sp. EfeVER01]MDZ7995739.1 NAD(P)/FAD-dependent oxidoreductase [Nostoc sp. EspVER01]